MARGFVRTRGRSVKLAYDGYQYLRSHKLKSGLQTWRCAHKFCPAKAYTRVDTGEVVRATDDLHEHWPNPERIEVDRVLMEVERRVQETNEPTSSLIHFALSSVSTCVLPHLPTPSALERMIDRYRLSHKKNPEAPGFQRSVDTPRQFEMSECASKPLEDSLLVDTGENDPQRIVIFGQKSTSRETGFAKRLHVDAAFKQTPTPFAQVLIIIAERSLYALPVAYVLLSDKTVDSYARMFSLLKKAWPALDPKVVVIGFEKNLLDGARAYFPSETRIQGRFADLVESVKLHIVKDGLWPRYKKGGEFSLKTRMIAALAFVPPSELSSALSELESALPRELVSVLHAFQEDYTGRMNVPLPDGTITTKEPQFPIEVWSIFQSAQDGEDWAVDYAKETRRRLQIDLGSEQPTLSEFTEAIKKEQRYIEYERERYIVGFNPLKREPSVTDQRIREISLEAGSRLNLEYLQSIARNINIKT